MRQDNTTEKTAGNKTDERQVGKARRRRSGRNSCLKAEIQRTEKDSQILHVYYSTCRITQKKGRLICLHDRQARSLNSKHAAGQAGMQIDTDRQEAAGNIIVRRQDKMRMESLLACKAQELRTGYTGGRQLHA
jgi:hypothetical protein